MNSEQEARPGELSVLMRESEERKAKLSKTERALACLKERYAREHYTLVEIVQAYEASSDPVHYELRAAISRAKRILGNTR